MRAILAFVLVVACIEGGECLRCWECNSALDINCKDYFNTTRLEQNRLFHQNYLNSNQFGQVVQHVIKEPHLENCEQKQPPPHDYKYVCLKVVTKDHARAEYNVKRECRMVPMLFKEGNCPEEIRRHSDTYYCSTCQRDACNSSGIKAISIGIIMFGLILHTFSH